jgi:hypothetical protein
MVCGGHSCPPLLSFVLELEVYFCHLADHSQEKSSSRAADNSVRPTPPCYFLNKFSKAWRASMGRSAAGVEVSFSTITRME